MKIDIADIFKAKELFRIINSVPLNTLELYEKGNKIKISHKNIEEFSLTGLLNTDFILSRYWIQRS